MWLVFILLISVCSGQLVPTDPSEGSTCNTINGVGTCTRFSECQSLANREVDVTDLFPCRASDNERVICCPPSFQTTPSSILSLWDSVVNGGEFSSSPSPDTVIKENASIPLSDEKPDCNSLAGVGVCKPLQLCEPYRDQTIRYADLKRCSFVGFDEIVCCPLTTYVSGTTSMPSTNADEVRNRSKKSPSVLACERNNIATRTTFHISGGKDATVGEFPYVGAVLYPSQQAGRQYDVGCGASLIEERFALTAAHCVINEPTVQFEAPELVRFGSLEWNPKGNDTYKFDARIKNITVHELYRPSSYYHDIAVIEFTEPVPSSMLIAPICLHAKMDDIDTSINLQIVGWGITSMFSNAKTDILQKADVNTVGLSNCNASHHDYGVSKRYANGLIEGQYCARDPGNKTDSCSGDSGGPLIVSLDDWEELVGVVSFGMGCGSILPSVYTRVAHYLEWIERIVWASGNNI